MRVGEQAVAGAVDGDLPGVPVEAVELDVGGADLAAGLDADAEPVRADPRDAHAVAGAAQLEVQRPAALVPHLRAPAERRRRAAAARSARSCSSYASMAAAASATAECRCETSRPSPRTRSIQPVSALASITSGWSSRSSTKLLLVAPPSMITVVCAIARRSRPSASSRSRPYAMIFAIIESKSAGMVSPSLTPVSTRMPGPAGRSSRAMRPGEGAKSRSGSSAFSRASMACPRSAGGVAVEPAAGGHPQLRLDQVEPGGDLGDRVLDLQAGVDLEEREQPVAGVVEELDGRRAAVTDRDGQPLGRRLELGRLRGAEHRRRRLLDDLLVAPLHRAVADAERPRGARAVGDHLDLDVPGAGDQALQEHDAAAERPRRLLAGALVRVGQFGLVGDHADAAPAAARGRLQHQRVADLGRRRQGGVEGLDRAAAPRRDRHADLLGEQLRADLVAEPAHGVGARADERDPDPLAQLRERRVLRDEAPADPGGVGPGLHQRALQHLQVEVRARGRGTEVVRDVGLADERGGAVDVGVQGDGLDRRRGLRGQLPDGVDEPHRGLTTVDDGDTTEHLTDPLLPSQLPAMCGHGGPGRAAAEQQPVELMFSLTGRPKRRRAVTWPRSWPIVASEPRGPTTNMPGQHL